MMGGTLLRMMMKNKRFSILLAACVLSLGAALPARSLAVRPSDETEVRGVVQAVFQQLKAGQYGELYDTLPLASRSRISRQRFINALERTR